MCPNLSPGLCELVADGTLLLKAERQLRELTEAQALEPHCLASNPACATLGKSLLSVPQLSLCKMGPMIGGTSQG